MSDFVLAVPALLLLGWLLVLRRSARKRGSWLVPGSVLVFLWLPLTIATTYDYVRLAFDDPPPARDAQTAVPGGAPTQSSAQEDDDPGRAGFPSGQAGLYGETKAQFCRELASGQGLSGRYTPDALEDVAGVDCP